jgi:hypothetical protein
VSALRVCLGAMLLRRIGGDRGGSVSACASCICLACCVLPALRVQPAVLRVSTPGEFLTFALVGGVPAGPAFTIDAATGQLSVPDAGNVAVSAAAQYNLTVTVRDAGIDGPAVTAYAAINVTIILGTFPPTVRAYNLSVPELSPGGTPVGIVIGASLNFNTTLTYSLTPIMFYLAFPFTITTLPSTGNGAATRGAITVSAGSTVNTFSAGPRLYLATLAVQVGLMQRARCLLRLLTPRSLPVRLCAQDNNPSSNFVAQSLVAINISYVPMPPYFNPVTQAPGSAWFQLQV